VTQSNLILEGTVEFSTIDYRDRVFSNFYIGQSPGTGPGWYIFGRNPEYGGRLVRLCGRPSVKARRHPHYNCQVRRGWLKKRDALAVLTSLPAELPGRLS
jgi:hypothetical protein